MRVGPVDCDWTKVRAPSAIGAHRRDKAALEVDHVAADAVQREHVSRGADGDQTPLFDGHRVRPRHLHSIRVQRLTPTFSGAEPWPCIPDQVPSCLP